MSGNPLYDEYTRRQFKEQTERGPGTFHRRFRPSLSDLSEEESQTLRRVLTNYDRFGSPTGHANLYTRQYSPSDQENIIKLEGLGFIRIEQNGRIVPSFVFQEHKIALEKLKR